MTEVRSSVEAVDICRQLFSGVHADFVGLALQNRIGPDVSWHVAIGNLNEKYKHITVRFGKGIAGKVISTGNEMMILDFPRDIPGKVTDYPIMLAEKLVSSYAAPLFFNAVPKGVLMVGKRSMHAFLDDEQERVKDTALTLERILFGEK